MKLRIPLRALLIAATGACGLLCMSTAQAEIRTGSASVNLQVPPSFPEGSGLTLELSWDVGKGSYYSSSYVDTTSTTAWATATQGSLGSFILGTSYFPRVLFYTTAPLDLGALVNADQTFDTNPPLAPSFGPAVITGGETKRFGYSVTMPESPSPLYGWVELDGSASTLGHLIVNGTWAYDTTGAGIAVGTVPEPTTLVLVGLGFLALLARYRFGRKQS
jgi:hypothetical protein